MAMTDFQKGLFIGLGVGVAFILLGFAGRLVGG